MRRTTVAAISVASSLALAACAERDTTSPRSVAPGQAAFQNAPTSTCNFTNVTNAARNYFTSSGDVVFSAISTWPSAYSSTGAAASTWIGWQVLTAVANERLTPSTTDAASGAALVVETVRCMIDLSNNSGSPLQLPTALTDNNNQLLTRVLNSGIFEVRAGGSIGGPAAGKNKHNGTRSLGSPIWGVETQNVSSVWPGTITYAVIGYPIVDNSQLLQSPPLIDTGDDLAASYQSAGTWPFNAFELTTLPAAAVIDHSTLRVGICVPGNAGLGSVYYLVDNDVSLVANSSPTVLCTPGGVTAMTTRSTWYNRLAQGAARLFTPGTLFAQDDSRDFIGGLPSGWSPKGARILNTSQFTFTITTQPQNNLANNAPNSLVVTATIPGTNTPVPQLRITSITVLNNSGQPAGAVIVDGSTNLPVYTDGYGNAQVKFAIGKPGSYYLVVSASFGGVAIPATTVKFNVKNH
jgi:hypothetical protein